MAKKLSFFTYIGGKFYLLDKLLKLIPPYRIYVEPFDGSAKLLLNKEPSRIEVCNDYDKHITNLFFVVVFKFDELYKKPSRSVYSRYEIKL
jgi:DNA adenine methylase